MEHGLPMLGMGGGCALTRLQHDCGGGGGGGGGSGH